MANLKETQTYEAGVYQLETTDPVVAGPDGVSNIQAKQLANRTAWLKHHIDELVADVQNLNIDDISNLQTALNAKLGLHAQAEDSQRLNGHTGEIYAPTGAIIAFAASTRPQGWLECNGASLSRNAYKNLYNVIKTSFGKGNGTSTFNLPDLRGEFIRGIDHGRGIDPARVFGSTQSDTMQKIVGALGEMLYQNYEEHPSTQGVFFNDYDFPSVRQTAASPITFSETGDRIKFDSSRVTRCSSETRPKNVAMLFCIKY